MSKDRALIADKKPDNRKSCEGFNVAVYEIHGLTDDELGALNRFMAGLVFSDAWDALMRAAESQKAGKAGQP